MKNTIKVFAVLTVLIVLGCSPVRDQQSWKVTNNSTDDIFIEFTHDLNSNTNLDTVSPGEEMLVYYLDTGTSGEDLEDPTLLTTVFIFNSTDSLTKDENTIDNWLVTSEKVSSYNDAIHYKYNFSVSSSDF
tara:strand:+ start:1132 stop:1524 length:393 start_codon:yes stop_codon:yes gene_type:complete